MEMGLRVLLIDDDPDDRTLVLRELRRGFPDVQATEISEATGLTQALAGNPFDLVITDYQLGWTDGLGFISRDTRAQLLANIESQGGAVSTLEVPFRVRDGSVRDVLFSLQTITVNGVPHRLATGVDITEHKRAEKELRISREQLRALGARLAESEEAERRRISRELHDRVGQTLTALGISLSVAQSKVASGAAALAIARLEDAAAFLSEAVDQTRDVMADLRPPVLDDYGLAAALRWHGERFAERTGVAVLLEGGDPSPRLASQVETALFRITQEALTNIAKHARARRVTLTLGTGDATSRLTIADDGAGFDPKAPPPPGGPQGWGLLTMRERAEAVGGTLTVEPAPGQGTRVVVEVPR